ncbi:hypothetical protein J4438_03195 [Candidatus Woesearchaeota archaeon]|nr:hypothetical protein [Candidatus Woesearchaeota archaeon]
MARTVQIQNSDEVMAQFGSAGIYYLAKLNFPIPEQSRFIYCHDIIDVLRKVGKGREAETLANIATNYLDMCTISPEFYELVKQ